MDINVCCSEIRHFRHLVHSSWLDEDIDLVTLIRTVSITQYCKKMDIEACCSGPTISQDQSWDVFYYLRYQNS